MVLLVGEIVSSLLYVAMNVLRGDAVALHQALSPKRMGKVRQV
jgi:hypothetical protein